jgi:transcription antitermination factor NusG
MVEYPIASHPDHPGSWYACYTRGRHEKRVDQLLRQRGMETFLPLVERTSHWTDRRKVVTFPMFPSYVFGRFGSDQLSGVLAVPGIVAVVHSNGQPVPISDEDIANVRRFAAALSIGEIEPELVVLPQRGERVRITGGPFAGVEGVVVDRRARTRVLIGLEAIGCGLQIEVDVAFIEAAAG